MIPQVKKLDVEVLGGCEAGWRYCQIWLDIMPNSLKRHWRKLMVEKLALNSLATSLVDIPAVIMPNACSLKT
jgi:hypothetical protein